MIRVHSFVLTKYRITNRGAADHEESRDLPGRRHRYGACDPARPSHVWLSLEVPPRRRPRGAGGDAALAEQRRIFAANRAGLAERDIVVIWVTGNNVRAELGPGPGMTATQLRARFGAAETGFRVALVGKDGGTKLSQSSPLSADALFGTIDSMPMRRNEVSRRF